MRLAWLTDLHLNFVAPAAVEALAAGVLAGRPDAVLVGGDTGEADSALEYLGRLAELVRRPVYFVLGNHDYYHGSVAGVRERARLADAPGGPIWLSDAGPVSLTPRTALVGHDGWGDGGFGDALGSRVELNDFRLITELRLPDRGDRLAAVRRLGEEAAAHFRAVLPAALAGHEHVVALTHVPPFREAAWHEGRESDPDWLPFFACRAAGEAMRAVMAAHPHRRLTVLCGHTHGAGGCRVLPNLTVLTGGAEYGRPRVQQVLDVE